MKLNDFLGRKDEQKIRIHRFAAFPEALQAKFIKLVAFTFLVLVAVLITIITTGLEANKDLFFMIAGGVLIVGVFVYLTYTFYQTAATGDYDVYEGTCTANNFSGTSALKVFSAIKKNRTISFESIDGMAYVLYCKENRNVAKEGFPIKIYTTKSSQPALLNGEHVIYQYLAIDSPGKRK